MVLRTLELSKFRKQDGGEGKSQSDDQLRDKKVAELAVIGWSLENTGRLIPYPPGDDEDLIKVLGAELAE